MPRNSSRSIRMARQLLRVPIVCALGYHSAPRHPGCSDRMRRQHPTIAAFKSGIQRTAACSGHECTTWSCGGQSSGNVLAEFELCVGPGALDSPILQVVEAAAASHVPRKPAVGITHLCHAMPCAPLHHCEVHRNCCHAFPCAATGSALPVASARFVVHRRFPGCYSPS